MINTMPFPVNNPDHGKPFHLSPKRDIHLPVVELFRWYSTHRRHRPLTRPDRRFFSYDLTAVILTPIFWWLISQFVTALHHTFTHFITATY